MAQERWRLLPEESRVSGGGPAAMTTFLELVNKVGRESGTISQQQELTTLANVAGRQRRIADWTADAWKTIQRMRNDWTFRRAQFSAALITGQMRYTAAELAIADFGRWPGHADRWSRWSIYDPAVGKGDEIRLPPIRHEDWVNQFDMGVHDAQRPGSVSVGFDKALYVGPSPDKVYTLRGWYMREIQTLTADDDEPYISEEFHDAIVWRALMTLGEDDEAPFEVASSTGQFREFYGAMVKEFTPPIELT